MTATDTPPLSGSALTGAVIALSDGPSDLAPIAGIDPEDRQLRRALVAPGVVAACRNRCLLRQTTTGNAFWRAMPPERLLRGTIVVDCRDPETIAVRMGDGRVHKVAAEAVLRWHHDAKAGHEARQAREWLRDAVRHPEWVALLGARDRGLMLDIEEQVAALDAEAAARVPCTPVFQDA